VKRSVSLIPPRLSVVLLVDGGFQLSAQNRDAGGSGRSGNQNARYSGVRALHGEVAGVKFAGTLDAQPLERLGVPVLLGDGEHAPEILVAGDSADVLRRARPAPSVHGRP